MMHRLLPLALIALSAGCVAAPLPGPSTTIEASPAHFDDDALWADGPILSNERIRSAEVAVAS